MHRASHTRSCKTSASSGPHAGQRRSTKSACSSARADASVVGSRSRTWCATPPSWRNRRDGMPPSRAAVARDIATMWGRAAAAARNSVRECASGASGRGGERTVGAQSAQAREPRVKQSTAYDSTEGTYETRSRHAAVARRHRVVGLRDAAAARNSVRVRVRGVGEGRRADGGRAGRADAQTAARRATDRERFEPSFASTSEP